MVTANSQIKTLTKRLFISTCVGLGTTKWAAQWLGTAYFLPQLFAQRYAVMGGLDVNLLTSQLTEIKSFSDHEWCGYWNQIAEQHETAATRLLQDWNTASASPIHDPLMPTYLWQIAQQQRLTAIQLSVIWEWIKASTYYAISAFPGGSPTRMQAYHKSRELSEKILNKKDLIPLDIEAVELEVDGEIVRGYAIFPRGVAKSPLVIVTNGLEGTLQELALPMLKYWESGMAVFMMEMPGTYAYQRPMSGLSEQIYDSVIEYFAAHPRINNKKIAMVGVSFGGYWSARMAAKNKKLVCAVAVGAATHHTFGVSASIGVPQIIVSALKNVTGSSNLLSLMKNLNELSFERNHFYEKINIPLLVINGDQDTLVSVQDSKDLAAKVAGATLKLYPNDDHCAMGHLEEWMDYTFDWLGNHLIE